MFSTSFLLLVAAFGLWYLAAGQANTLPGRPAHGARHPQRFRWAGSALLVLTAAALVLQLGWMTGLSAWLVGLMAAGGLVVALAPFGFLKAGPVTALYVVFLGLELLF